MMFKCHYFLLQLNGDATLAAMSSKRLYPFNGSVPSTTIPFQWKCFVNIDAFLTVMPHQRWCLFNSNTPALNSNAFSTAMLTQRQCRINSNPIWTVMPPEQLRRLDSDSAQTMMLPKRWCCLNSNPTLSMMMPDHINYCKGHCLTRTTAPSENLLNK